MSDSLLSPWSTALGQFEYPGAEALNPGLGETVLRLCQERGLIGQGERFPLSTHHHADIEQGLREALPSAFFDFLCVSVVRYLSAIKPGKYDARHEDIAWIWPNLSFAGDFHEPHTHSSNKYALTGVYYVQIPTFSRPKDGALSFIDPRGGASGSDTYSAFYRIGREVRLPPSPGRMVLFPPHLKHYVYPHSATLPRISLAFDVSARVFETVGSADAG